MAGLIRSNEIYYQDRIFLQLDFFSYFLLDAHKKYGKLLRRTK